MTDPRVAELQALLPQCLLPDWVRLGSRLVRLLRDRHHAASHEAVLDRLLTRARQSVELRELRRLHVPRVSYPPDLPITARKDEIVAALRAHQVVVIAGETGSGKTTQIPKMCLEAGLGVEAMIGCTQPRRVAALSISRRLAEELQVAWGREVGCKIRFDDRSGPETYLKLMTDGILLAETQGDPLLSEYNALIIDEAHERSLNIDFLLGYLKGLLARRRDLKLVVTSATIDTAAFSRAFDDAPVIEVSGRTFPVEVRYAPLDEAQEERGDFTYVDGAVRATQQVLEESSTGDVLIFMPGERDIREAADQLEGRFGNWVEVVPLYGRLSSGDQQRVFAPSGRRKVVIATNIAETSLTIPGIRFVIDTGLARLSRYNARTRTRRLPVEPVSQSSANQRKGRAGRVEAGVCIRLYPEEDFLKRPPYTQPEIQRANLAEVILRMKAFRLGEIESFPFLNPPAPAAISGGYQLLQELGALDAQRALTPLGRDLARLPIDPTLGRMLLQSRREQVTRELLIIAAGLSIQDPRERPLDQAGAADAAHRRHLDPRSDFLGLLNLWQAVHASWETLRTQNQRRRFCRDNFLSYVRLREWQDLHSQLEDALGDLARFRLDSDPGAEMTPVEPEASAPAGLHPPAPSYEAIHRAILSGLLGHLAHREERNLYQAAGNRRLTVFPGSVLFQRGEPTPRKGGSPARPAPTTAAKTTQPAWIMAGEIVETSQLFARTLAGIDPQWVVQLAPHLCQVTHQNPHWSVTAGRVLADEIISLHGLELQRRKVAWGNLQPRDATAIFLRSALVEDCLLPTAAEDAGERADLRSARHKPTHAELLAAAAPAPRVAAAQYRFLDHNRRVREKIENWQTRVRRPGQIDLDRAFFEFYARHLENVASVAELDRVLRGHPEPGFLCATEADLVGDLDLSYDAAAFPDAVSVEGHPVPLTYAYAPGEERDGVTFRLPLAVAETVSAGQLDWAVPGLRAAKVEELLRSLPKALRRELMPFPPKVVEIVRDFRPGPGSFRRELARFLHQRYGVQVPPDAWDTGALPAHLQARVEVVDGARPVAAGRDLDELRARLPKAPARATVSPVNPGWAQAVREWEKSALTGWSFGDLPGQVPAGTEAGLPVEAWPGLEAEGRHVNVRLFRSREAARRASREGFRLLVEQALERDLGWVQKDLRSLAKLEPRLDGLESMDDLQESAFECLRNHALPAEAPTPLTRAAFDAAVAAGRQRLAGLVPRLQDQLAVLLDLRRQVRARLGMAATPGAGPAARPGAARPLTDLSQLTALSQLGRVVTRPAPAGPGQPGLSTAPAAPASPMAAALEALLPAGFLRATSWDRLPHLARYLKALLLRIERAAHQPPKEQERARQLAPYLEAVQHLRRDPPKDPVARLLAEEFRWLVEEFKVSLFAQELGTAVPVSPKRLDELLAKIRAG